MTSCFICKKLFFLSDDYESFTCEICKYDGRTNSRGEVYFHRKCWEKELKDVRENNDKYYHLKIYTQTAMHEILHHSSVDIV